MVELQGGLTQGEDEIGRINDLDTNKSSFVRAQGAKEKSLKMIMETKNNFLSTNANKTSLRIGVIKWSQRTSNNIT